MAHFLLARLEIRSRPSGPLPELGLPTDTDCRVQPVPIFRCSSPGTGTLGRPMLCWRWLTLAGRRWSGHRPKNHRNVIIASNPDRYASIIVTALQGKQAEPTASEWILRRALALEAYEHTAAYDDSAISDELHARWIGRPEHSDDASRANRTPSTRYPPGLSPSSPTAFGTCENSHQAAALYADPKAMAACTRRS